MNFYALPSIVSVIGNLALGTFVYVKDKKNNIHKSFASLCFVLAIYSLNTYLKLVAQNIESAYLYSYVLRIGVILTPFFLHHFILQITKINDRKEKIILGLNGAWALLFLGINFTSPHLLVIRMTSKPWGYVAVNGPLYNIHLIGAFFFIFYAIYLVTSKYKTTKSPTEKNQMYCLLISFTVGSLIILSGVLATLGYNYPPTGNIATFLFLGIIAFTILRRGTINTIVIFEQSFLYLLMNIFLIIIYMVIIGTCYLLFIKTLPEISLFATILVAIIISHIFQPLKEKFSFYSKRIFFKIDYDASQFLLGFNDKLRNIFELNKLLFTIVEEITKTLRCSNCFIMLYNEDSKLFEVSASIDEEKTKSLVFEDRGSIAKYLSKSDVLLIREDLDIWSGESNGSSFTKEDFVQIMDELRTHKIAICIPLFSVERLYGILCLGDKTKSIYTPNDLYVLRSIKGQINPAIKNLMLLEEMRRMKENLYQADKLASIGTLVSEIVHEIKNPLVSISVFAQLIKEKMEDKNFQEKLKNILPAEIEKLNKFLEKLLNFSKTSESQYSKVKISEIVDGLLPLLKETLAKQHIILGKSYFLKDSYILGDNGQLEQVFMNIIMNAVQAMPNGGNLNIELFKENKFIKVRISDNGCGIPQKNLSRLFEPFFTTKEKGTGLGLSICKRIIREHKGEIKVLSKTNKGTVFEIEFPAVD
ncbi:MAG: ATP-binding protein [bacterium]|nr:ATP-binding protein [bacterium]